MTDRYDFFLNVLKTHRISQNLNITKLHIVFVYNPAKMKYHSAIFIWEINLKMLLVRD